MKGEVLAHFQFTGLTCMALVLFFILFVGAIAWVYRSGSTHYYDRAEQLPLSQD